MKPSRIVILSVALVAAGLAGLVAMQISGAKQVIEKAETIIQKEPTVNVLVSSVNLPVGSRLNDSSVRWTPWPQGNVVDSFITEAKRPDAITELAGTVVRLPLFEGEPIRPEKVVDSSNRIMSSLLPMRQTRRRDRDFRLDRCGWLCAAERPGRCHHGPQGREW